MKRQVFHIPRALRIERIPQREGVSVIYCCWQPGKAWFETDRKAMLRAIKWPIKTPTGDALRVWLDEVDTPAEQVPALDMERIAAEGFGPESHGLDESDPNHATKMVT